MRDSPCADVTDRTYVGEYPVDCVYEGERTLYIHPDECVDCSAYEPVCPIEAIYYEGDLPEGWPMFELVNAEFFDDIGSPGGAQRLGPTSNDHPYVAGLLPQGK